MVIDDDEVDRGSSLVVDDQDRVHVAYIGSNPLKHATHAGDSWAVETIDRDGKQSPRLVLGANDALHVSYHGYNGDLRYARRSGALWSPTVLTDGRAGTSDIAVDRSGTLHIAYAYFDDPFSNAYVSFSNLTNGTGGLCQLVSETARDSPSIAIDSSGNVHFTYVDSETNAPTHATNASGTWQSEVVDESAYATSSGGLALDENDRVHIAYRNIRNKELRYATNLTGSWRVRALESENDVGRNPALGVDSELGVHISYLDETDDVLKYIKVCPEKWLNHE